jgi:hypothetical protein
LEKIKRERADEQARKVGHPVDLHVMIG